MQTFLPLPSIQASVACLDRLRLGKQRLEARQLLRAIRGETQAWANHPAARIWHNHPEALAAYYNATIEEWIRRGYRNTMLKEPIHTLHVWYPPWWGDHAFHASHRAALLFKDPTHYAQFGWTETPQLNYVWPL